MIKYAGWILSIVLLILLIVTGYNTTARSNAQLKAQSDNFTANYNNLLVQNAQRDAQWQATLNAAIAERNVTWNATLAATSAQRDAEWRALMNSTVNASVSSSVAARDAYWQSIFEQREAQWRALVASLQGT